MQAAGSHQVSVRCQMLLMQSNVLKGKEEWGRKSTCIEIPSFTQEVLNLTTQKANSIINL